MDTTIEVRKASEIQDHVTLPNQPLFSNGCKIGTLLFVGSMIIIGGIIVGISVGLAK
jgi:carbonic anhydrase/acetyltransferase-like protein (isoleucine patch superfamily)